MILYIELHYNCLMVNIKKWKYKLRENVLIEYVRNSLTKIQTFFFPKFYSKNVIERFLKYISVTFYIDCAVTLKSN